MKEILALIKILEKENRLDAGTVTEILEKSIEAVARKKEELPPIKARIDEEGNITMESTITVCPEDYIARLRGEDGFEAEIPEEERVENPMTIQEAKRYYPDADLEEGDQITQYYNYDETFGRIDVQTIKQITSQKIKEAKKNMILNEYRDKIGDLVSGTIVRIEHGSYIVELEHTEASLPRREQLPREHFKVGERLKAVVCDVKEEDDRKGPRVILSRAVPAMIRRLFEIEVPEIYDGIVEIKSVARVAGSRSKIAVLSHDPKVDCVGACVGVRGARVKSVVQEINNEKVDIVRWSDDLETFVKNALDPTELLQFYCGDEDDENAMAVAVVPDDQYVATLGIKGQNVRMISKLVGHPFSVITHSRAMELEAAEEAEEAEAAGEAGENAGEQEDQE
ncbi:transcription termination factor NusA [bacterium]|nr:transcription termination factor NusA [bacterium]